MTSLTDYLKAYGTILGQQAERSLAPLHVPGSDPVRSVPLLRKPYEAQEHVIEATRKSLSRQKATLIVAEMGTGKTLLSSVAVHAHADGKPYRALVFCPGQLLDKWRRELLETIPGAKVTIIDSWRDLLGLDRRSKPAGPEWFIIARDRAKLGYRWRAAVIERRDNPYCPQCGMMVCDKEGLLIPPAAFGKRRMTCQNVLVPRQGLQKGCGSALWQATGELWRYEPALYIKRRLHGFFRYLILDEVHEEKGADTAQANAAGSLAAACKKVIALTGTLIGGYAEHLRPLLFRLSPSSLVQDGLGWSDAMPFSERYGRIETRVVEKEGGGDDNRQSRGASRTKTKRVRPGIMPPLFGKHLIDKAVFLSLNEIASCLPTFKEEFQVANMDHETAKSYREMEEDLSAAIREMIVRGDKRLLGTMLNALLCYPDYPFGWSPLGYYETAEFFRTVHIPASLDQYTVRPKEEALIKWCLAEREAGRQSWVYVQYTDKHDVQTRLEALLGNAGLRVGSLRASVSLAKREPWIIKNAPKLDVVISHPKLVETGLDLFDKKGSYNFPSLAFYETGYNLFTLRQASRRSWRLLQKLPCKVAYFCYAGTMQERALALMGSKMAASQAIEGRFAAEGLSALAGEDGGSIEMALARSLAEKIDSTVTRRAWGKVENEIALAV